MEKHRSSYIFLLSVLILLVFAGFIDQGYAELDGELAAPPPLEFTSEPELAVVPSEQYPDQYAYVVPDVEDVYVYQGMWYRNYNGVWFRATAYNGVWLPVSLTLIPPVIISIPVGYALVVPSDFERVPWNRYNVHWREWEKRHHWHNHNWYKHELRAEVKRERMHQIKERREAKKLEKAALKHHDNTRIKSVDSDRKNDRENRIVKNRQLSGDEKNIAKPDVKSDLASKRQKLEVKKEQSFKKKSNVENISGQVEKKTSQREMRQQSLKQPRQQVQSRQIQQQSKQQVRTERLERMPKQQVQKERQRDNKENKKRKGDKND
jgi:hypothetical protein